MEQKHIIIIITIQSRVASSQHSIMGLRRVIAIWCKHTYHNMEIKHTENQYRTMNQKYIITTRNGSGFMFKLNGKCE